ncbi:MAG TPA: hypothetical protein DDY34_01005 [Bacteroidales bacterium]|nr:hypothetical protein [Bacteroidales bacterium]
MLHKEIPFLRIIIPLCAGIISNLYTEPGPIFLLTASVLIAASFLFSIYFNRSRMNILFGFIMTLALILCGHLMYSHEKNRITILEQKKSKIICTVSDFPEERENSYRVKVRLAAVSDSDGIKRIAGSMLLYIRKDSSVTDLLPGDILKIVCIPAVITARGNPCEFDYRSYMENHGIKFMSFISKHDILGRIVPENRRIVHRALIIRERIIEMYRNRGITGRNLALVAAMTVGEKTMLEPEQKENFRKAGVMHIMAVSGLHAMVLSLFVFNILFFLKRRFNILRIILAISILWAFAFVTGLTPSVMRATLMFSFIQAGSLMKRPANSLNSVLSSAFVLILIRPSVIFDTGFLLSYSAVIFIIAFYRNLYIRLQLKNWLADKVWQSVVVAFVAQAGTFPLTVMLFNRFPAYFLITNVIIVPLSSLIIITGCMIPLLYPLVFLSGFLGTTLNYLTSITEFLTETAASLPGSTIGGIGMPVIECILLTLIITILCYILINNQLRLVKYLLTLVLMSALVTSLRDISVRRTNELIVYNSPGATVVGIRTGKILNLYSTEANMPDEVMRHISTLSLKVEKTLPANETTCIEISGRRILISGSVGSKLLSSVSPEIVILTGPRPLIKDCSGLHKYPEMLILSSETASGFSLSDEFSFLFNKTPFNVRKSGAFIMSL